MRVSRDVTPGPPTRKRLVLEFVTCAAVVTLLALNALWKMDYLSAETVHRIRMTDSSRSAYVGKHIAEGDGYKTNDLPAQLLDFYHQRGKLHDEQWVNADRFPFTAYAIAALYTVTGSTSSTVGVLVYNVICFVLFLVLLFRLARSLFGESWTPLIAVVIALLHPFTYLFLYQKDADMLALTTGMMSLLVAYARAPTDGVSKRFAIAMGTLLAWLFLTRPNLGAPFVIGFAIMAVRRWRRDAKEIGPRAALRRHVWAEGLALIVAGLWLVPLVIHSMIEWGSPLFSANHVYQLPLGTRYDMGGTDTWWKYTEPGHPISLGTLLEEDRANLFAKFTTSWFVTDRSIVRAFAIELLLAFGALWWLRRTDHPDQRGRLAGMLAGFIGAAGLINFLVLPLYGYQHQNYRAYLGFIFPLIWLLAAHAIYAIACRIKPAAAKLVEHMRANAGWWIGGAALVVIVWNLGGITDTDANPLWHRTTALLRSQWRAITVILILMAAHRWVFRPPWTPRVVLLAAGLVLVCFRPDANIKRYDFNWFPANDAVWDELRKRDGIASSLAIQSEVAWNTDRKNIPAPEWPMHIYSFKYDHAIEIEDLYIESAAALIGPGGPFSRTAPGFESYQRLQEYREGLPGYELAFHDERTAGNAKFDILPTKKASTVYKLVDRDAVAAMQRSPDRIELGDPRNVVFTAHGWGRYYEIEGKRVAAATDSTRLRYRPRDMNAWEDTSITFFVDERRPAQAVLEFYAPAAATYTFYWNLDLYVFDRPADRARHQVGVVTAEKAGWQRAELPIPAPLIRMGLNKLGFRVSSFQPVIFCASELAEELCREAPAVAAGPTGLSAREKAAAAAGAKDAPAIVMRPANHTGASRERVSLFASSLSFVYSAR